MNSQHEDRERQRPGRSPLPTPEPITDIPEKIAKAITHRPPKPENELRYLYQSEPGTRNGN